MNQANYEKTVVELTNLLGKILKVSRHSDPSAKQKKAELLEKYNLNLRLFGSAIKEGWNPVQAHDFLRRLPGHPGLSLEPSYRQLCLDKIKKDLGQFIAPKADFPEFEQGAPEPPKPQYKPKEQAQGKRGPMIQDPELLMRMASQNPKEQQATNDLKRLIDAINKVGPDALERHIKKHYKKEDS